MTTYSNPSNPSRIKLQRFLEDASRSVPAGSKVLDAGAGEGYYQTLFEGKDYYSVDLCKADKTYGELAVVSDLANIPFHDNCFDLVICTQVMEHVSDPRRVLNELTRVLKPGHALWISTPFFYEQHEIPYDYYRYTTYGLQNLLEKSQLHIKQISWLEGYYGALAYQCNTASRFFAKEKNNYLFALIFRLFFHYCTTKENNMETAINQPYLYGKNLVAIAEKIR